MNLLRSLDDSNMLYQKKKNKNNVLEENHPVASQLAWETAFTEMVAGGSCFRPLVAIFLLKAAFCTALIPLCRGSWSQELPPEYFLLQCIFFMVLHLSIQPSHQSSTLDVTLAGQRDGGSSGLTLGHSGEVPQEPLLAVCTTEDVRKLC